MDSNLTVLWQWPYWISFHIKNVNFVRNYSHTIAIMNGLGSVMFVVYKLRESFYSFAHCDLCYKMPTKITHFVEKNSSIICTIPPRSMFEPQPIQFHYWLWWSCCILNQHHNIDQVHQRKNITNLNFGV